MHKHQKFMELHKFYYSHEQHTNPLPYRMQHARNVEPAKLYLKSRLRPISYLECPVPVYHLFGEFYISTRTLAGILGTFRPWHTDDPNDPYKMYRLYKREQEDRLWAFADSKGWTTREDRELVTEFFQYPAYQQSMVNRTATVADHKNIMNHVSYYAKNNMQGIVQIDAALHEEIKLLMQYEQEDQPYNALTKYFLAGDHRVGGYLVDKEGASKLLSRYAKYNLPKDANLIRLMQRQVNNLIGRYEPTNRYKEIQATISVDLSAYKEGLTSIPSSLDRNVHAFLALMFTDIESMLLTRKYIKKVEYKSDHNWNNRILLDKVSNDDTEYEDDGGNQVQV